MIEEVDYITLSALQHYSFCARQCALIHTDRCWAENSLTTLGHIEHERVHASPADSRGGVRTARGLPLVSHRLRIRGQSDAVEYRRSSDGQLSITPVEYKHGRQQSLQADSIQLCAQALCLEEMHDCRISEGVLYYHSLHRRTRIPLNDELREQTRRTITAVRELLSSGRLPPAEPRPHCRSCSLSDICLPGTARGSAAAFTRRQIAQSLSQEP